MGAVVLVGGGGYVGQCLARELAAEVGPLEIRVFDWSLPPNAQALFHPDVKFFKGDVRRVEDLVGAMEGAAGVFHLAAVGMTGKAALDRALVDSINVGGTHAVIEACRRANVQSLLYASSINAVFRDTSVRLATEEEVGYTPSELCLDNYSRTKGEAEALVLGANGSALADGGVLRTCALRFPGVYGVGEQRHQPRVVSYVRSGLFLFTYSQGGQALIQWVNGPNAAQAFRRALHGLSAARDHVAAGQAYFVNDGPEVNSFESFRPLVEVYTEYPDLKMPFWFMMVMARLMETFFVLLPALEGLVGFEIEPPGVTRAEVAQIGITHTYSIAKAQRQLGYRPTKPNSFQEVADFYRQQKEAEDRKALSQGKLPLLPPKPSKTKKAVVAAMWLLLLLLPLLFSLFR